MEERKYRTYPKTFKLEAIRLLETGQKRTGQIEEELGITPGLLLKWRARYKAVGMETGDIHLEPSDLEAARAEIRRLQRKLAEAEEEREILKKAVNIFSRTSL
jgi:transposase